MDRINNEGFHKRAKLDKDVMDLFEDKIEEKNPFDEITDLLGTKNSKNEEKYEDEDRKKDLGNDKVEKSWEDLKEAVSNYKEIPKNLGLSSSKVEVPPQPQTSVNPSSATLLDLFSPPPLPDAKIPPTSSSINKIHIQHHQKLLQILSILTSLSESKLSQIRSLMKQKLLKSPLNPILTLYPSQIPMPKRSRGRPKGSKNRSKSLIYPSDFPPQDPTKSEIIQ